MSVKFNQNIYQENLLLKKVLMVTAFHPQDASDPFQKMGNSDQVQYLESAYAELRKNPSVSSMLQMKTLFDTILSDMLNSQQHAGFSYLLDCYSLYLAEKDKSINQKFAEFLTFIKEMIVNYASLLALNPDLFPNTKPVDVNLFEMELSAFRLVSLFESSGYSQEFMQDFNAQLKATDEDMFKDLYVRIFKRIRDKFMHQLTVVDSHSTNYLDTLNQIFLSSEELKSCFLQLQDQQFNYQVSWIPGGISLCTGDLLEQVSTLGPFFSLSFLPVAQNFTPEPKFMKVSERIEAELKVAKSQAQFEKIAQNFMEMHRKYNQCLCQLVKTLLKSKQGREETLKWLAASISGNASRAKMGHNLAQNNLQNKLNKISSDSFCLNVLYLLFDLCAPFLNLNDPKELWKKIDPTYIPSGVRINLQDETPICASKDMKKQIQVQKEYGTVSEFYFLFGQMVHFGLMHSIHKYLDVRRLRDRLEEERKMHANNQFVLNKIEDQLKNLRVMRISYELTLTDSALAKALEKYYTVHMKLMRDWGEYDEKQVKFADCPPLFTHLPESQLQDMIDVFTEILKIHPKGVFAFSKEVVVNMVEFCTAVLHTHKLCITNPYTKAKALELISLFVQTDQKKELMLDLQNSAVVREKFIETIIWFYVDIEFAGDSHMFYTKFQYRHDCSTLLQRFWPSEHFRARTRAQLGTEYFEKFLNSLMNDLSFCMEEGLAKLKSMKKFEMKQEINGRNLTKEDKDNYKSDKKICSANMQLAAESVWNIKQLALWCKEAFENETFAERIANTLNYVLKALVGPESQEIQVRAPEKVHFKSIELIDDLIFIYTQLCKNSYFCKSVVKDERSFKPEYLSLALRKLKLSRKMENLANLEQFISVIPQYSQQESQMEELLGNDAPDDFICPISCDLMRDPVLLPTSGKVCDKKTMKQILLNDEHDPFNRQPLRLADLKDDLELKARIEKWIEQKKAGVETDEDKRIKEMQLLSQESNEEMKNEGLSQQTQMQGVSEEEYSSDFFSQQQNQMLQQNTGGLSNLMQGGGWGRGGDEDYNDYDFDDELQEAIRMSLQNNQ